MSKKNIVSIEDRIPNLKQARKRKANRRLIFYLSIFFFLIAIIVYFQSPLSHISKVTVTGNEEISQEEVIELSGITTDMNIWSFDREKAESNLLEEPLIDNVSIERNFPQTVRINVKEQNEIAYLKESNGYTAILEDGRELTTDESVYPAEGPVLFDFETAASYKLMVDELALLNTSIRRSISEIHFQPTEDNPNHIQLYMNDGFIVEASVRNFSDRMNVYPSISSQLDPEEEGIIHIGVGVYFESFEEDEPDKELELDEESAAE